MKISTATAYRMSCELFSSKPVKQVYPIAELRQAAKVLKRSRSVTYRAIYLRHAARLEAEIATLQGAVR